VGPFIVDFVCPERMVVIEVDGGQHDENKALDIVRSEYLNRMGFAVYRFWNNEVIQETEAVLEAILGILMNDMQHSPSPRPSPPSGEREKIPYD
jgi:very-short-patch-repair endonuclease